MMRRALQQVICKFKEEGEREKYMKRFFNEFKNRKQNDSRKKEKKN